MSSWSRTAFVSAALVLIAGAEYGLVAEVGFLADDYALAEQALAMSHAADALDPTRAPLRPLLFLSHYAIVQSVGLRPDLARLPGFAFHLGTCALVYLLARRWAAGPWAAAAGALLFALYPALKALAWPAALNDPAHSFFLLAGLACFLRHQASPRWWTGAGVLLGLVLGLGFKQNAVLLPVLFAVWLVVGPPHGPPPRRQRLAGLVRDPWLLLTCFVAGAYVVYLGAFRAQATPGLRPLEGLPANVVKSLSSLCPEVLRSLAVEGLRGHAGLSGMLAGGLVVAGLTALILLLLLRGSCVTRFVVVSCSLYLLVPVLVTGFQLRHAYLAAALGSAGFAAALARPAASRRRAGLRVAGLTILAVFWAHDSLDDARDLRAAGQLVADLVRQAGEARERAGARRAIVVVDLPLVAGSERDIPTLNFGFLTALRFRGIGGPWQAVRTTPPQMSTDQRVVTGAWLAETRRDSAVLVLDYDAGSGRLVSRP